MALPVAGLLQLEFGGIWRFERWDVSDNLPPQSQSMSLFNYGATAFGVQVRHIPHYRVEIGAGFEYRNRSTTGDLPDLFDSLNTGLFSAETSLRLIDGSKYQNRLHVESFAARRSVIGNTQFTGGTAELNNRVTVSKDTQMYFDWSLKGGTARGLLPVDDYFVLGVDTKPTNLLRGHKAAQHGKYGSAPMGTDFVLLNTDIDRRLKTIPFFNNFGIPFITVKSELFFDVAKTWDRNHIFLNSKLLLDTGVGLRLETPTNSFNLIYGKSLRDGNNVFTAYYERRLW
jgi:hypothetical protein